MVRRGSTVRVRQRALCKAARRPLIAQIQLLLFQRAVAIEPLVEFSSSEGPAIEGGARICGVSGSDSDLHDVLLGLVGRDERERVGASFTSSVRWKFGRKDSAGSCVR